MRPAYSLRRLASSDSADSFISISEKPMMALSGVRNSWLMVARKRLLAALARSASACASKQRLLLALALGHVAQHRDDFAAARVRRIGDACSSGRQRISIQTNSGIGAAVGIDGFAPHAELDRTAFSERRGIAERRQISGPVGDMDALEQTMAVQFGNTRNQTATRRPARQTGPRRRGRAA